MPEVQEFFNLEAMERGKSYAERAHSMAAGGLRSVSGSQSFKLQTFGPCDNMLSVRQSYQGRRSYRQL